MLQLLGQVVEYSLPKTNNTAKQNPEKSWILGRHALFSCTNSTSFLVNFVVNSFCGEFSFNPRLAPDPGPRTCAAAAINQPPPSNGHLLNRRKTVFFCGGGSGILDDGDLDILKICIKTCIIYIIYTPPPQKKRGKNSSILVGICTFYHNTIL